MSDAVFLDAVRVCMVQRGSSSGALVTKWDLMERLGMSEREVLDLARSAIERGVLHGCACGCRGDFWTDGGEWDGALAGFIKGTK